MALLKRKAKSSKIEEYKPSLYPSFTVCSSEGVSLNLDAKNIGKVYNSKVKFTGIDKRTKIGKDKTDWSFEIQSIDI